MNARSSLIVVLLATNFASLGYIAWQKKSRSSSAVPAADKPAATPATTSLAGAGAKLSETVTQRDATALRDLLRGAHYPEETVQKMVSSLIWSAYDKRREQLYRKTSPEKWWAPYDVTYAEPTAAELTELTLLEKKALAEEIRIFRKLSEERMTYEYQFLPPEKQLAVAELTADYAELFTRVGIEAGDFNMPADEEKRRLLNKEQEKDIEALLTPEERRTRELRQSINLGVLDSVVPLGQLTEAEYIQIFDLQKAFDEKYPDPFSENRPRTEAELVDADVMRKERDRAEAELNKDVIAMLGEARVAEQKLKNDSDFRLAEGATKRFALPADTPKRLLEIRASIAAETQRIYADTSLSNEAKTKQLESVGQSAAARVKTLLGDEAAQAIAADSNNLTWLKAAQAGRVITSDEETGFWGSHAVDEAPEENVPRSNPSRGTIIVD